MLKQQEQAWFCPQQSFVHTNTAMKSVNNQVRINHNKEGMELKVFTYFQFHRIRGKLIKVIMYIKYVHNCTWFIKTTLLWTIKKATFNQVFLAF